MVPGRKMKIIIMLLLYTMNGGYAFISARVKGCVDVDTAGICTVEVKFMEEFVKPSLVFNDPKQITWIRLRDGGSEPIAILAHVSVPSNGRVEKKKINYKSKHSGFVVIRTIGKESILTTMTVVVQKNKIEKFACDGEPAGGTVEIAVNVTEAIEYHGTRWYQGDKRWRRRVRPRKNGSGSR
ncbi:bORF11 [Murid betaherpesvirus 8]|uniref:BORF11 n=1 Tax=Rat cytomegalovirus (isolate England) TaxID=1261657 RepID=A0A0E3X3X9_RCMVE|nr:bORF11 [Murid betaherpesvirus 8]WPH25061.1 bORF11 [Murid betaherpesvirus 8]WPH25195.1 bORF11 [Murid betaherpesvirus 8]